MKLARVATRFLASVWAALSALSANAADKPPLELAKTGYLYAGGHIDEAVQGQPMVGHLYAEEIRMLCSMLHQTTIVAPLVL